MPSNTPTPTALRLREGAYYRNGRGHRVGPMRYSSEGFDRYDTRYRWTDAPTDPDVNADRIWLDDGRYLFGAAPDDARSLIEEWHDEPTGPVRTTSRVTTEILPGLYGPIWVGEAFGGTASAGMRSQMWTAEELRAAAQTLTDLAEGLDKIEAERNTK